jgi:putative ABC transport system ATP-binding protein
MDGKSAKVVSITGVTKEYELGHTTVSALRGIDLEIEPGEFAVLAGPSGSGKSTLLNIIGCLDYPTAGEVRVGGLSVSELTELELDKVRSHLLGFIFQSFNLVMVLDVYENIELPLLIRPEITPRERRERVLFFMEKVGLTGQMRQKPYELSGGQQQRVAIARALVTKPQIILADEPTANLDSKIGLEIIELMHEINRQESATFIFSSHDPKIISRAGRVVYLEDGSIKEYLS